MLIEKNKYFINRKELKESVCIGVAQYRYYTFYVDKKFWTKDYFYVITKDVFKGVKKELIKIDSIKKQIVTCGFNVVSIITEIEYTVGKEIKLGTKIKEEKITKEEKALIDNYNSSREFTYGKYLLTENLNYTRGIKKYITHKNKYVE
jgi:hypothetical protein